jgi:hypothetical protein
MRTNSSFGAIGVMWSRALYIIEIAKLIVR